MPPDNRQGAARVHNTIMMLVETYGGLLDAQDQQNQLLRSALARMTNPDLVPTGDEIREVIKEATGYEISGTGLANLARLLDAKGLAFVKKRTE